MAGYVYSVDNEMKITDQSFEGQSQRRCMLNERLMTVYPFTVCSIKSSADCISINQSKRGYA